MSSFITVSYSLNPPPGNDTGNLKPSKDLEFPIAASVSDGQKRFYGALREGIEAARNQVGEELTAWRDAVGKAELNKETKKTLNYDQDEDGEGEEEEA